MDNATRHQLKNDPLAVEAVHAIDYVSSHKQLVTKVAIAVVALLVVVGGIFYYRNLQAEKRQAALAVALRVREGKIGALPATGDPLPYFPSLAAKQEALRKALLDIITRYEGSDEAAAAHFHLGVLASDEAKIQEAEKEMNMAAEGSTEFRATARWALYQIYRGNGQEKEAEEILRDFVAHPTALVSKEQASLELASLISKRSPAEARSIAEPLSKLDRSAVARYAQSLLVQLPAAPTPEKK